MPLTLLDIRPPHGVRDEDKLKNLIGAYRSGTRVTPVVYLNDHSARAGYALCGSHRVVAALAVFGGQTNLDDLGWIGVDMGALQTAVSAASDAKAFDAIMKILVQAGNYVGPEWIQPLIPYLGEQAKDALMDQWRDEASD